MTDLCLLAASLLASHQASTEPPLNSVGLSTLNRQITSTPDPCQTTPATGMSVAKIDQPEFSDRLADVTPSNVAPSNVAQPAPTLLADVTPAPQPSHDSSNSHSTAAVDPQSPELSNSIPIPVTPFSPNSTPLELELPASNPVPLQPLRPTSGSQLYQQRLAALQAGRTYTRLPADSFRDRWLNATQHPTYEQWSRLLAREAEAMARGQGTNRLTVLLGDSLYQWYPPEQLPGDRFWLNQGISGDTTTGVLRRLSAFAYTRPDTIHVMVGINDLRRGASDAEVIANLQQIMSRLRQNHPQARIYIHSILPTRLPNIPGDRIRRINQSVLWLAKQERVHYLDVANYFADAQGNLRDDLTTDGLHLNARGYAMWQLAMEYRS